MGSLPNGVRYIVRRSPMPPHRAELRLVVDAGSVLEDADQLGYAHFVEHMAFNGTRHFPKHALVDYLRSVGLRFGADLNAETGYDQTTYKLTVPTDSAGVLDKGIEILADWAHGVTFDSGAVVAERGVVLEEWRLRSGGGMDGGGRLAARFDSAYFPGARYGERLPIGTVPSIQAATPAPLKRFYHDWYRPDLMAVIVVGDVDRAEVVRLIRERFGALRNPTPERPRPPQGSAGWAGPRVAVIADSGLGRTVAELYYRLGPDTGNVMALTRPGILRNLFVNVVRRRLTTDSTISPPVLGWAVDECGTRDGGHCLTLSAAVANNGVEQGLAALYGRLVQFQQYGPTAAEFDAAKLVMQESLDAWARTGVTRSSGQQAADYVDQMFSAQRYVSGGARVPIARALLAELQPADLTEFARACCTPKNLAVVVSEPAWARRPNAPALLAVLDSVSRVKFSAPAEPKLPPQLLATRPEPGRITTEVYDTAAALTEWTLANGMRVLLKQTAFSGDQLLLRAIAPGGSSVAPDSLWTAAQVGAPAVVQALGWGAMSPADLEHALFGFGGAVSGPAVQMTSTGEEVDVTGSPRHAELLFQLLHLAFTPPRADTAAFATWKANSEGAARVLDVERNGTPDGLLNQVFAGDNPRARPPTSAQLDSVSLGQVVRFYQDRFADASNFTVVLVGALTPEQARPLIERYLASLPSVHRAERSRPLGVHAPSGVVRRSVHVLSGAQAVTVLAFHGPVAALTPEVQDSLKALLAILQVRLTDVLRGQLAGTYSVGVALTWPELDDRDGYLATVQFTSAPDKADTLAKALLDEVGRLQRGAISPSVLAAVVETRARATQSARVSNDYWLGWLTTRIRRGWPLTVPLHMPTDHLTVSDVASLAREYLNLTRYVHLTLLPADNSSATAGSTAKP